MNICHSCQNALTISRNVARRDVCPACGSDLRCCLNCRFYAPAVSKQCRETAAELVAEKSKANYCDYFVFADRDGVKADAEKARRALDQLFGK